MKRAALYSALLHFLILALLFFGLPSFEAKRIDLFQPVAIEVVKIGEETTALAPKSQPKKDNKEEQSESKPKEPAPEPSEPRPEVKPEPEPELEPKPEAKPEPKPEPEPDVEPKPELFPKPKPEPEPVTLPSKPKDDLELKPEKKPKPKPNPKKPTLKAPERKESKEKNTEAEFTKLLKNLKKSKPGSQSADHASKEESSSSSENQGSQEGKISDQLTQSELDAVRQQIAQCWNVPAGVKEAENLRVVIYLMMNPDGTIREVKIHGGSTTHPLYQIAADSALRAVKNPMCSPLKLPLHRYEAWKEFTFTFDPKDMFQ